MSLSQNSRSTATPLVDYVPAELKKGNKGVWRIEFYAIDPTTRKMKRYQRRVKPMANKRERERYARKIVLETNRKLENNWNPKTELEAPRSLVYINEAINAYINKIKKEVTKNALREDTLRSYRSWANNLIGFIEETKGPETYCLDFNQRLIGDFLDHIYYDRDCSPRTHNNYLSFIYTLSEHLLRKDYIKYNPCIKFERKRTVQKAKETFSIELREKITMHLKENNPGMLTAVLMLYYQLIRRTEMTKLKVSDIDFERNEICIRPDVGKTDRNNKYVTILAGFVDVLKEHVKAAKPNDFVFSKNKLLPGQKKIFPKMFNNEWNKLRKEFDFTHNFYSLKHNGINDLLNLGMPAVKVRDHARHKQLKQTEDYSHRNNAADINKHTKGFEF